MIINIIYTHTDKSNNKYNLMIILIVIIKIMPVG